MYAAGELGQCDFWFPPITLSAGSGQVRTAFPGAGTGVLMPTWPVVALMTSRLGGPAMTVTYELARLLRTGSPICATS